MSDIREFLLDRITEDETTAETFTDSARWWKSRALAECEAKRKLLAIHCRPAVLPGLHPDHCFGCGYETDDWPITEHINDCPVLQILAAVYKDHPDYKESS